MLTNLDKEMLKNFMEKDTISPLEQFEIRNILSLEVSIFNNINLSLTNIGLYLMISLGLIMVLTILSESNDKLVSNNLSLNKESLFATINNIVIGQINRKEGQIYFPFIYTLFIFIVINNLIGMVARCLLKKINIFILNIFQLLGLINKPAFITQGNSKKYINRLKYSTFINKNIYRPVSTLIASSSIPSSKNSYYLNPYYITGFVDGEGCFTTSIFKDSRMLTGWQIKPIFKIYLHNRDKKLLEAIQRTFGVGKIYKHGKNSLEFRVSSLKNLKIILDHFDKYPLITKKWADYILFKESVNLIEKKEHLTQIGLLKLVGIKSILNRGLPEKFKELFPNMIFTTRPEVKSAIIKDTNWLRGFVETEGSFHIVIQESKDKSKQYITLRFTVSQHSRDKELLKSFVNYLDCGKCYLVSTRNEVNYVVSDFSNICEKIIPLFEEYSLIGNKKEDYLDFVKVAEIIKSKSHLTNEGIEKIKIINNNMNSRRVTIS